MRLAAVLAVASLASLQALSVAAAGHVLANDNIKVTISATGTLRSIENRAAGETYPFRADSFVVDTDLGRFTNRTVVPERIDAGPRRVVFHYVFKPNQPESDRISIDLIYTLSAENGFFRRTLRISNPAPLRLGNVRFGDTAFESPAEQVVHYVTFIAAPTVEFIRFEHGGLFTGIENPYFRADLSERAVALHYEPALILKAAEGYTSEPQFMGVYKKSGVMIEDSGRDFRYNANGSGYKPIDRNEMRAMRAYALDYLDPAQDRFLNINYQFFHPLPQFPDDAEDADYFYRTIDSFSEIGGDMIIFKPLHRYRKPDQQTPYWNVVPENEDHTAGKICDYARDKGIPYGFYMGIAAHGGEGNAAGLPFRPDKPEWKKTDAAGRRAPDNCLACDEFHEWWFHVQNNTIRRYGLGNWSWDPSLGSGMNCHNEDHGHFANQGGYKGWRRCIELMGRLKAENPGLFIQGFYGTKNFGLWGLKHVDQHEVYNEQTIIVSTRHHQISDDRQQADGLRFQNNWSMRFRFTPAVTGHSLVHRINEGTFDPEMIKAWDYYGWKYSVMSSLAVAGSVMPTILPYETEMVPGYVDFYRKWTRWAQEHFEYVNHTEPFGEQVVPGAIDGYARIKGDHGFIFLFNGNPRPAEITFEVGDEINLQAKGNYQFREIYPSERGKRVLDEDGRSIFARGQTTRLTVPANACRLIELQKAIPSDQPVLVGAAGSVQRRGDELIITGVKGKPGRHLPVRVRVADPDRIKSVTVNGVGQSFRVSGQEIILEIQFEGEPFIRELDQWTQDNGSRFVFPYHGSQPSRMLATTFHLNNQIRRLLEQAKPGNYAEIAPKLAEWRKSTKRDYSYHNFICEQPWRLWLIVPFLNHADVEVEINGEKIRQLGWDGPSNSACADLTHHVKYGHDNRITLHIKGLQPNQFMGPYLLYPDEASTDRVRSKAETFARPVRYTRPPVSPPRPRHVEGKIPKVVDAKMMDHVTLLEEAELRVRVDLPRDQVARVMYFESGFRWMGQHTLEYNEDLGCWTNTVHPGRRGSIQENETLYVWVEARNGLRSEYYPVRVHWDFVRQRNP